MNEQEILSMYSTPGLRKGSLPAQVASATLQATEPSTCVMTNAAPDEDTTERAAIAKGLEMAIAQAGSMRALGGLIGISQQAISQWKRIPAKHIIEIERTTGVPRNVLRPDLYRGYASVDEAIAFIRAAGYRIVKPKTLKPKTPKRKDRVGPTYQATFSDDVVTRMSVFTSLENLDWGRGERLAQAAYQSRWRMRMRAQYREQNGGLRLTRWQYRENAIDLVAPVPPAIVAAHFEQDGKILAQRPPFDSGAANKSDGAKAEAESLNLTALMSAEAE